MRRTRRSGHTGRRLYLALPIVSLVFVAGLTALGPARAGAAPYCGVRWGSLPKSVLEYAEAPISGVRTGRHDCWDRFVIDLAGAPAPGYNVRYVDAVRNQDTGAVLAVGGGAVLLVTAHAHGETLGWRWGDHVMAPSGFRTFRDVVYAGTYEGSTDFALGVRARLPFRVFPLSGPGGGSRLVIDVAHKW